MGEPEAAVSFVTAEHKARLLSSLKQLKFKTPYWPGFRLANFCQRLVLNGIGVPEGHGFWVDKTVGHWPGTNLVPSQLPVLSNIVEIAGSLGKPPGEHGAWKL